MKKKIFSTLLMGAFFLASMSMFTSCKDYDDDINNLQKQIDALTPALQQVKTDLQNEIQNLKSQLEAKDAELLGLIQKAQSTADGAAAQANTNKENLAKEIIRATAAEAALETRIKSCEDAIVEINKALDKKVDKEEFDKTVGEIYVAIGAVDTRLSNYIAEAAQEHEAIRKLIEAEETARKIADADLQEQITALDNWKKLIESQKLNERIAAIEADYLTSKDKQELNDAIDKAKKEALDKIEEVRKDLQKQIDNLGNRVQTLEGQMEQAQKDIDALESAVSVLNYLIKNDLRSLVFKPDFYYAGIEATKMLSLEYYHFVDADKKSPIPAANADTQEKKGYDEPNMNFDEEFVSRTKHERYDSLKAFKVLNFMAQYHMNPSNADLSKVKANGVTILSDDKEYVDATRAAACGISVDQSEGKGWFTENGMLKVNLKVNDQEKIKNIGKDGFVTVFATQVAIHTGEKDTTITSDYAALRYEKIKEIRLAHSIVNTVAPEKITMTGLLNNHCGACNYTDAAKEVSMNGSHLFATVAEAKHFIEATPRVIDGINGEGQDTVNWNETLDLSKLVEAHYTTVANVHDRLTADKLAEYGLQVKFELTKLILGTNKTSESAQAAINGNTLRPQLPARDGKGAAFEATEQSKTTVNRVPLVRVSLIEKASGHVLDYGYIPVRISQPAAGPEAPKTGIFVEYTSPDKWTHTQYDDCFGAGATAYGLTTAWVDTQYDLMKHNQLPEEFTREDFEKTYLDQDGNAGPLYQDPALDEKGKSTLTANPDEAQQYTVTYKDGKPQFTLVTSTDKKIGVITYIPDENLNGTRTSVFKWEVNKDEAIEKFGENKEVAIACLLKSNNGAYPDIYVIFKSDPNNITFNQATVTGKVAFDGHMIDQYWYSLNANGEEELDKGFTEIHAQVKVVEDFFEETAKDLDDTFADVFVGNFKNNTVTPNNWITITTTIDGKTVANNAAYDKKNIQTDFIFETAKNTGSYKGIYQNKLTTFKLFASDLDVAAVNKLKKVTDKGLDKGKNLYAYVTSPLDAQLIATIEGDDLATMKIALQHSEDNAGYAEALLNYKRHNELADDVLKANVSLVAWIISPEDQSECFIPLTDNSFIVRFLRPLNVAAVGKDVIDATSSVDEPQKILLDDLLSYTDWREAWKDEPSYKTFYGIKAVKLRGVEVGENISVNEEVVTNLNQAADKFVPLTNVSDNVDFVYSAEGELTYRNLSSTVTEFQVILPVEVEYLWGTIYQDVTVTIKRTQENAKKF